jgi:hypothetical protein
MIATDQAVTEIIEIVAAAEPIAYKSSFTWDFTGHISVVFVFAIMFECLISVGVVLFICNVLSSSTNCTNQ